MFARKNGRLQEHKAEIEEKKVEIYVVYAYSKKDFQFL